MAVATAQLSSANGDDWRGITDSKQRKKIQDKLAQRARRGFSSTTNPVLVKRFDSFSALLSVAPDEGG